MSKAAAAAGKHALPALGETRCYWALMDAAMNFRYIDPVLRTHMNEVNWSTSAKSCYAQAAASPTQSDRGSLSNRGK